MLLWHENYIPEKGLLLSLSKYSNHTKSKGYQGFAPQNFLLNLFVTEAEKKANTTPNIISYISKKNLSIILSQIILLAHQNLKKKLSILSIYQVSTLEMFLMLLINGYTKNY